MQRSPLDADNRYTDLHRIIYRVFSSAFSSVENGNNSGRVIDHPLISDLETGSAIARTDIFYEVCCRQYLSVCFLPILTPTALKSLIGASTHQFNIVTLGTEPQHDLGCPDVHSSCHSRYKDIQPVSDSLADFFFQIFRDGFLVPCQLFGAMTRKAHPVQSFFSFGHNSPTVFLFY